ncbi:hypothetical protein CC78DRAFT_546969 [Lojkania enalia]|uniref:Uncharacterized protein n=1 Tax=Lojkania enalia TaxID=147567 RepID=A0A9P4K1S7_9PLEO|nr:hypothetical protein CC78DRAFT_546969 [Didymosphaeria enalia]
MSASDKNTPDANPTQSNELRNNLTRPSDELSREELRSLCCNLADCIVDFVRLLNFPPGQNTNSTTTQLVDADTAKTRSNPHFVIELQKLDHCMRQYARCGGQFELLFAEDDEMKQHMKFDELEQSAYYQYFKPLFDKEWADAFQMKSAKYS